MDIDVDGATFAAVVKAAGVKIASCSGDATQDVVCKLPLGVGSVTVKGEAFPIKAGLSSVFVDVKVSSLIPASLASVDTHTTAVSNAGEKIFCMDVHTEKQLEAPKLEGATLAVTWTDCGDADTHTKLTDLQPTTIETGATTTLTGTGNMDIDVDGATFAAVVKAAGVKIASCSGDATQDVVCKLPLGVGSVTVKGEAFPIKAGLSSVFVDVKVSSLIPASLASVDTHTTAVSNAGEKIFCMDVHTEKQELLV